MAVFCLESLVVFFCIRLVCDVTYLCLWLYVKLCLGLTYIVGIPDSGDAR